MTLVKWTPKRNVMSLFDDVEQMISQAFNYPLQTEYGSFPYSPLMNINEAEKAAEVKDKKAAGIPEVPAEYVKYYLGSNFLVENFNIPEHRVEEFIRFVEYKDFDFNLLNYGNELEFLEVLYKKSKIFLAQ